MPLRSLLLRWHWWQLLFAQRVDFLHVLSCRGAEALGRRTSVVAVHGLSKLWHLGLVALQHGIFPTGVKPMHPALAGGFLTTREALNSFDVKNISCF